MKRKMKRLCCALLSATTLMSTLSFLPVNAVSVNPTTTKQEKTNYESTEIPEGMGATGDLSLKTDLPDDTKIIKSVDDYYKVLENDNLTIIGDVKRKKNATLPSSVDNSQSKYFPPIGDQSSLGACVTFAQVYYQFSYTYNKAMDIEATAENTFSPKFVYNFTNSGIDNGTNEIDVFLFMQKQGNVPLSMLPYNEDYLSITPTEEIWSTSIKHRIKDYQFFDNIGGENSQVTSPDDSDLQAIKTALSNGEILSFSTWIYGFNNSIITTNSSTPENKKYEGEGIVTHLSSPDGDHRMTIVGYNDNIWTDINKNGSVDSGEMGAFKIANSWGEGYRNNGFIWVAYDALNKISSVSGMENEERCAIFERVARISVAPNEYNSDIYLRFTLNTSRRTQPKVNIYAERNGSENTCEGIPELEIHDFAGDISFDGSEEAHDGTLVCPLDRVIPDINSDIIDECTFRVEFSDSEADGIPTIVKEAAIVDKKADKIYTVENIFPFTLDGNKKTVELTQSSLNNIVLYYIGYDNPTVHIKEEGKDWYSTQMPFNTERRGATHKYIFETDEDKNIQLYFTDGDNKDDNNDKYFTASNGLNFFRTNNVREPLTAQYSTNCEDVIDLSQSFNFFIEPKGGYAPYTYEIILKNLDTGEEDVSEYEDNSNINQSSSEIGNYVATINVKDYANDVYTMHYYYEVKDLPFEFKEFTVEPQGTSVTGKELHFKAITKSESVNSHNGCRFVIKCGDEICYTTTKGYDTENFLQRTSTTSLNWTPTKAGIYTITVSTSDANKQHAEKSLTFEIKDDRIGDVDGDGIIDITDVTATQMHIAKITNEQTFRTTQADCDKNNEVNIDDITQIQMYIAKYDVNSSVGEVITYKL